MMDRTLKALSLMLSYPTAELQAAMPEIGAVLAADPRLTAANPRWRCNGWPRTWGRATCSTFRKAM